MKEVKKIFGKQGIIDNETRRWDKQADQATKKLDKQANQIAPDAAKFLASLLGLPNDENATAVVDENKASEVTLQSTPEVQAPTDSGTNATGPVESVANSAIETEAKGEKSQEDKELITSSFEITPEPQEDITEVQANDDSAVKALDKTTSMEEEKNLTNIDKNKIFVIADKCFKEYHEKGAISDNFKIMLRTLITTPQELEELKVDTYKMANSDVSLLDHTTEIVGLYSALLSNIEQG